MSKIVPSLLLMLVLSGCVSSLDRVLKEKEGLREPVNEGWLHLPAAAWQSPIENSPFEPESSVQDEEGGPDTYYRKLGGFKLHRLPEGETPGGNPWWIDVTDECKEAVEKDYLIDASGWADPAEKQAYYERIEDLIEKVAAKVIGDLAPTADWDPEEKERLIGALKALAWQESAWLHYSVRGPRLLLFVGLSGFNTLGDWGITQIARSGFKEKHILNKNFFDAKGYCSVFSSLYYGFAEYFYAYLVARKMDCNGSSEERLLGAYNRYVSGFSACHDRTAKSDFDFASFQRQALESFGKNLVSKPWESGQF